MKINGVSSLELSKRLKELGVKQDSLFYWEQMTNSYRGNGGKWLLNYVCEECYTPNETSISAFTVAELGEILPVYIRINENEIKRLYIRKLEDGWVVEYGAFNSFRQDAPTLADAMTKMVIWLKENKYL